MKTMLHSLLILLLIPPIGFSQGRMMRDKSTSVHSIHPQMKAPAITLNAVTGSPLPAGTYTIGAGGLFPTIDSAFSRLHSDGISGPITMLLTDTSYVAPLNPGDFRLVGPIPGAGPSSRITIRPADNVAATIHGSGTATLTFEDVSYLTLDGISLEGSTRLKVHTVANTTYDWNDAIDLWGDCDHDTVQNLTAGTDRTTNLWTSTILLLSKDYTTPDSCVVSGVSVTSGGIGIYIGTYAPDPPKGNAIRGCHIGSPTDSLISRGIETDGTDGTIIENNTVENLRLALPESPTTLPWVLGINPYLCRNTVIRNNVVHGLRGSTGANVLGIMASGVWDDVAGTGRNLQIYNNFVYDIRTDGMDSGYVGGISVWRNDTTLVAYNTVKMEGKAPFGLGTDALSFGKGARNATVLNNILVNVYQGGGNSALWIDSSVTFTSDHNDLYIDTTVASSSTVVRWINDAGVSYRGLSNWQATGHDMHSVSVMPPFGPPYLHIDSANAVARSLNAHAAPLAAVTVDFDGQPRDAASPDIGADEFSVYTLHIDSTSVWIKDPLNPIISGGTSGAWNRHVFMPCVLFNGDSSRYEMWFGASYGPPNWRPYRIGFAVSKDGNSWTMHSSPVLSPDPGTWEAYTIEQPMVIREDGQYKMWYTGSVDGNVMMIGFATSPDGIHWTKYSGNPVLGLGNAAWDGGGPYSCAVLPSPAGYRMWYGAYSTISPYPGRIGYATSTDGIAWRRDTVYNPVLDLGAHGQWDQDWVLTPHVLQLGDTYVMWYSGGTNPGVRCGGAALSTDMGITWRKDSRNPVLVPSNGGWDGTYVEVGTVMQKGKDSLEMWYAGSGGGALYSWGIGRASARTTGIAGRGGDVPQNFILSQNYPNPFNPSTAIDYQLSATAFVTLKVYDILGREVATLVNERKTAGTYTVRFDAAGLASGVYLYRVVAGDFAQTKKMIVVK